MQKTTSGVREIETTTLPNGVRVISETMPHVRSVSVGLWVGIGSRRESPEQNGLSHFIEHMVFKGTSKRSAEDIARSVDSILGTRDTVNRFDRAMMEGYYRDAYSPANLVITAAGNLTHKTLADLARDYFSDMKPRSPMAAERPPQTHARITLRNKKSLEQVHVCLGVPSYPVPHEDRFTCYVMNTLLGGGMSSRLFQNIRERQGLAYAVFSELNPYRDTGCLSVYAGTSIESVRQVIESILREFLQLKQERITEEELRRAKDHLKGSLMLSLESTSSRMSNLARQEMYFGRFFSLDELAESIERVTASGVQGIAQKFFDQKQIGLTVLGNLDGFKISREDLAC